jgi:diadenosine tetraphosphate (Ap4A) HIT family hydrolase
MTDCYSCEKNASLASQPPRERIILDEHWRAAHVFDTSLPGWLVLMPRRHVTTIAELNPLEAASLGVWQVRLSQALQQVTGCVKTYVVQFAEHPRFAHVHFHIVPRGSDISAAEVGPGIFSLLGVTESRRVDAGTMDSIALSLAAALS